jgi:phosphate uptake regulator
MIRFDNHAFKGMDEALRGLYTLQETMGEAIGAMLALLPAALNGGAEHFPKAKEIDKTINDAELKADALVMDILGKFTATGEDLRYILGSIKTTGTFERVADKTKNAIKRLGRLAQPLPPEVKLKLAAAVDAVAAMVPLSLRSILDYSDATTRELLAHGTIVQQSYRAILVYLAEHRAEEEDTNHILLVAKNLEQAADMLVEVMKIAHQIHFGSKYEKESSAA